MFVWSKLWWMFEDFPARGVTEVYLALIEIWYRKVGSVI